MSPLNDSDRIECSYHSTHNNDSSIPEINLSLISSFVNATATPQNNTGLTGISSQPLLITQPTMVDNTPNTPGKQIKKDERDWLHCFSPPTDPSFFVSVSNESRSLFKGNTKSSNVLNNDYCNALPSKEEQLAIYNEMYQLYTSFDHKRYPFAAIQLKVALFVLINAIVEKEESFLDEDMDDGRDTTNDNNDLAEKKRQTRLFLQQVWKNARTTIISAEAHIKHHDPDCRI